MLAQIAAHFRFFLHIDLWKLHRDDLMLIFFTALIILLMVGGPPLDPVRPMVADDVRPGSALRHTAIRARQRIVVALPWPREARLPADVA